MYKKEVAVCVEYTKRSVCSGKQMQTAVCRPRKKTKMPRKKKVYEKNNLCREEK